MTHKKSFVRLSTFLVLFSANAQAWDADNNPANMDYARNFSYRFDQLPRNAELPDLEKPWSSTFWPHQYGSIAYRWNAWNGITPPFASDHMEIYRIQDEMEEIESMLYSNKNLARQERLTMARRLSSLRSEKANIDARKASKHAPYFFNYHRPSMARNSRMAEREVKRMSREQLAELSPAEKFDIYMGRYDFPLTNYVLNKVSPGDAYWEGICNAWSTAAIEFEEPAPQVKVSRKGLDVPFGSSDIKGLLSFYHNFFVRRLAGYAPVNSVGKLCDVPYTKYAYFQKAGKEMYRHVDRRGNIVLTELPSSCTDTNAGAFHVVLANYLGRMQQSFVAEVVVDYERWNQPLYGYDSEVVERAAGRRLFPYTDNRNVYSQVRVKTTLKYANDGGRIFWGTDDPEDEFYAWWDATNGTSNYRGAEKEMEYILDLDRRGNIIDGHWLSYERPDQIWFRKFAPARTAGFVQVRRGLIQRKARKMVNYMSALKELVRQKRPSRREFFNR